METKSYEEEKIRNEFISMASRASEEIKLMRKNIEYLTPKAEAYDNMALILNLLPRGGISKSPDLTYQLDRRVEELKLEVNQQATEAVSAVKQDAKP